MIPDLERMRRTRHTVRLNHGQTAMGFALHPITAGQWPDVVDGVGIFTWHGPPQIAVGSYMLLTVGVDRPYLADAELGAE